MMIFNAGRGGLRYGSDFSPEIIEVCNANGFLILSMLGIPNDGESQVGQIDIDTFISRCQAWLAECKEDSRQMNASELADHNYLKKRITALLEGAIKSKNSRVEPYTHICWT